MGISLIKNIIQVFNSKLLILWTIENDMIINSHDSGEL